MTEAHSPTDPRSDWPPDRPAPSSLPTTHEPTSERVDPPPTVSADESGAVDLEPVDLDAIEADLDRVESALQQLADGTYWDQDGASVEAPTANDATSAAASTSGPSASA